MKNYYARITKYINKIKLYYVEYLININEKILTFKKLKNSNNILLIKFENIKIKPNFQIYQ